MTRRRTPNLVAIPLLLLVSATSCNKSASRSDTASAPTATASPAISSATMSATPDLRAAAEPFELLTETAFDTTATVLDAAVQKANMTAQGARASLPDRAKAGFDAHLAALATAHAKMARADVALSSIEVYRDLVSAAPAGAKIPSEVSLLDYAGFRYDADLKAGPARWADMGKATAFAEASWTTIAARVKDSALTGNIATELAAMKQAVDTRDTAAAARSVKAELGLVDQLEAYFDAH